MGAWKTRAARHLLTLLLTVALGGFLGAGLVRSAPGFGVDERELDTRWSGASLQSIRGARVDEGDLLTSYARHMGRMLRGDFGFSQSLGYPVRQLFAQRLPVTLRSVALGLLAGWMLALGLALPGALSRGWAYDLFSAAFSGVFLCLPSALLGLLFFLVGGTAPLAIGLVVFPKVFRYTRNVLQDAYAQPHILTAHSRGLSRVHILLRHVLPVAAPQLLALLGVSVTMALGAAIPIEVICDSPGIGQLTWLAALGRDLPLLVNLTILVTVVTTASNLSSDLAIAAVRRA
ncbi:MAG: ABC transporter permease subunit [Candidatus Acidiferrales bacterium]